eukprot:221322-Pleurochrysis_carterae.AAC.1
MTEDACCAMPCAGEVAQDDPQGQGLQLATTSLTSGIGSSKTRATQTPNGPPITVRRVVWKSPGNMDVETSVT